MPKKGLSCILPRSQQRGGVLCGAPLATPLTYPLWALWSFSPRASAGLKAVEAPAFPVSFRMCPVLPHPFSPPFPHLLLAFSELPHHHDPSPKPHRSSAICSTSNPLSPSGGPTSPARWPEPLSTHCRHHPWRLCYELFNQSNPLPQSCHPCASHPALKCFSAASGPPSAFT